MERATGGLDRLHYMFWFLGLIVGACWGHATSAKTVAFVVAAAAVGRVLGGWALNAALDWWIRRIPWGASMQRSARGVCPRCSAVGQDTHAVPIPCWPEDRVRIGWRRQCSEGGWHHHQGCKACGTWWILAATKKPVSAPRGSSDMPAM